jgi:uridine kinase
MKICILICGLTRSIDLVINNIENIFSEHNIDLIVSLNNIFENNKYDLIFNNSNIIKKIFINDIHDNSYRNSLNYSYKLCDGLKILPFNYDLYIIIRTDIIINNIDLSQLDNNKLYFSNKNINQFTKEIKDKVNDNIIITKNYNFLKKLINLYNYNLENNNYLDIVLYNYLKTNNIEYDLLNIDYKLILSKCNIIAIAGDSGSGKSTLMNVLKPLFENESILTLETDRYHKWERGDNNYQKYTHLNPYANHLEKMYEDVYDLKIGNEIYQVDYDHSSGRFTQKEKIESKNNIILCGLHTLYENKIHTLLDIKIFMNTDRELIKKWKIHRDVMERGYSLEKVLKQIEVREKDYEEYIINQKNNADIIINFYENLNKILECKLLIQNSNIIDKIIKNILELNYSILIENNILIINLKNNDYYIQIFYIISLIY